MGGHSGVMRASAPPSTRQALSLPAARDEREGNDVEPSRYGRTVTLDTAASIWFTAARMGHIGWIDPPTIENNAH
jgi:streptogramin lyase